MGRSCTAVRRPCRMHFLFMAHPAATSGGCITLAEGCSVGSYGLVEQLRGSVIWVFDRVVFWDCDRGHGPSHHNLVRPRTSGIGSVVDIRITNERALAHYSRSRKFVRELVLV